MTPNEFKTLLCAQRTTDLLNRWIKEDQALAERLRRERNEELVVRYLRTWFAMKESQ